MDLTYNLFDAVRGFDNQRRENRREYLDFKKQNERFRGSVGYNDMMANAKKKRESKDQEARKAAAEKINPILEQMRGNVGKMAMVAPTPEQVAILQVLSLKTHVSREELNMAAQSMGGNTLALSALNDIADKHYTGSKDAPLDQRYHENYMKYAKGIDRVLAGKYVDGIAQHVRNILKSPVSSTFMDRAMIRKNMYGAEYDVDELPQRDALVSERQFYSDCIQEEHYDDFMKAVNAKEG